MARFAKGPFWLGAAALLGGAAAPAAHAPARADQVLFAGASGDVAAVRAALPHLADPIVATLARLEIAAALLDEAAVAREIAAYAALHDSDPQRLALAASIDAGAAFARGDYARAERASGAWLALLDRADPRHDRQDAAQLHAVAALLARAPAIEAAGAGQRIATTRDAAGLLRGAAVINGVAQQAVLDTGANLPVLSASLAAKLHIRMIDGAASVGSSSRAAVATRIGVADRVRFAGFTFRNVPFLVLDDSQLALPLGGGYRIDAIIGFPVFRAIGSVTFGKGYLAPGPALLSGPHNLTAAGNDLFVSVAIGGFGAPLHLDTGARASNLSANFAERYPEALRGLERSARRSAGVGGATDHVVAHWKNAPITLAGARVTLADLPVVTADSDDVEDATMGTLGQDVLGRFAAYTVDLDTMRFAVREAR